MSGSSIAASARVTAPRGGLCGLAVLLAGTALAADPPGNGLPPPVIERGSAALQALLDADG